MRSTTQRHQRQSRPCLRGGNLKLQRVLEEAASSAPSMVLDFITEVVKALAADLDRMHHQRIRYTSSARFVRMESSPGERALASKLKNSRFVSDRRPANLPSSHGASNRVCHLLEDMSVPASRSQPDMEWTLFRSEKNRLRW